MDETEVRDERPDIFGPYFPGMKKIHNRILEFMKEHNGVKKETVMFPLQCTYGEYVGEDHDGNYEWKRLFFDGDINRCFAVGVNKQRIFSLEENKLLLISEIMNAWTNAGFSRPEIEGDILSASALSKPEWEMVLSIHFYYDKRYNDDEINDTQYCKIVYTHSSLAHNLEKIRLTSSST